MMVSRLAIVGYPLLHTFSPYYFQHKFKREGIENFSYEKLPIKNIKDLPALIADDNSWCGLNVTTPHKESIIPLCAALTHEAKQTGAVNCISITNHGWIGHNTDVIGFQQSLSSVLPQEKISALVLGNGGAAKAVTYVLEHLQIPYKMVVRQKKNQESLLFSEMNEDLIKTHHLIINTTTLGLPPQQHLFPDIPYEAVHEKHVLFDLVYNDALTPFLQKGLSQGATTKDGLDMLHLQAEASWQFWKMNLIFL